MKALTTRSPTVDQRRLARVLRALREEAGLTIEQVAEVLEISPSTIFRIETAQVSVRRPDVRALLDVYQVAGPRREELLRLGRDSRRRPWWEEYKELPNVAVADMESAASSIYIYSALRVPGLLQTEDYAREVLRAIRNDLDHMQIQRRVELAMRRQSVLTDREPPALSVVLDEAALRRAVGGPEVMRTQLQRLVDAAAMPSVTLQVLEFAAGANAGLNGEFTILRYPDPADPEVVYLENAAGDLYLEHVAQTQRYAGMFDHLRASALDSVESARFLADSAAFFAEVTNDSPLSVFISYSHKDKETAQALADRLTEKGIRTWVDEGELRIGDSLVERIAKAISEVEFVVALLSKHSIKSKWCQRELSWAMREELRQQGVRILPLRIDQVDLPPSLAHVYYLQVDSNSLDIAVDKLVADAASHHAERYGLTSALQGHGLQPARPTARSYIRR